MRNLALLALVTLMLSPSAALSAAPNVHVNWDQNVKFSKYHTYTWVPRITREAAASGEFARVRASIDHYLVSRGFGQAANPDFVIAFSAVGAVPPDYQGSYEPGWGSVARLSIDIYDASDQTPDLER
jgi:hypothetical protein